jgi:glycerol-3-phosphate dehydrogenase
MKVLVIGGGVFGTSIACELSNAGHQVTLVEKNDKIMQGASKVNHNRVHFGYHYPRSPGTARQCLDSLPSFLMNYGDAVISDFPNYYAIASEGSFITPEQFVSFCNDVRIDFREEYPEEGMMNKEKLSASFKVQEPIFSTRRMAEIIYRRLSDSKVDVLTSSVVESAKKNPSVGYSVMINGRRFTFDKVVNASYSGLNVVNNKFGVRPRELRFERTVVPVFKFNSPQIGLTVMGAFCHMRLPWIILLILISQFLMMKLPPGYFPCPVNLCPL